MQMSRSRPAERLDAVALSASERARARSLLDSLSEAQVDIRQGVDEDLLERERKIRQMLDAKAARQVRLTGGEGNEEDSAVVAGEMRELTAEYERLQTLIRSDSPQYAALIRPQPLSLEQIQEQVLDEDTVLLEYALGEDRSYLWLVTHKELTSYVLPSRTEIEERARRVYGLLTARQARTREKIKDYRSRVKEADSLYWEEALELSELLVGPVASQLGKKRLLVVSDGALQYLPFAALPFPDPSKPAGDLLPIVFDHEIVNLPSASILVVLRQETNGREYNKHKSVAIFADPVFERDDPRLAGSREAAQLLPDEHVSAQLDSEVASRNLDIALRDVGLDRDGRLGIPRLPFTRQEADAIAGVTSSEVSLKAVDFHASRVTAMSPEIGHYRIVHFATHGLLNSEHPELSGIILSLFDDRGRPQKGFLGLHDIYNLDLPVDLIVLSACSSGLGKQVRGEGLVGIVRGFMYAGAARVVASLWKVDDEATGVLMEMFYRQMLVEKRSPASALRHAQIAVWRQEPWRSPFYWAAFVLQGEWK